MRRCGASLANTPRPFELLLLPDGPDNATRDALAEFTDFAQLATDEPRGAPACFNRLIAATQTDVVVLLESGSLVGRCWAEGLLAAMRDPRNGLAGPSTNLSWNEQSLARHAAARAVLSAKSRLAEQAEVDRVADAVRHRFGGMMHGLEPLHSLADFCYARPPRRDRRGWRGRRRVRRSARAGRWTTTSALPGPAFAASGCAGATCSERPSPSNARPMNVA